jgi:type I restriction enzyme, S subunit
VELKSGYKLTDIGVIPIDWEVSTIGEVTSFSGGSQPPRSTFKFSPAEGYIRLIQIRDYKSDEFLTYIPKTLARKICTSQDIMIGRYGPPIFQILQGINGAYNVALIKATPNKKITRDYLHSILKQEKLFNFIDSLSRRSSGQTGVEMPALKSYGLPLPPLAEQALISSAIADMDVFLLTLDKIILKKKGLKQAVLQGLLSGQTRLPGYSGEWISRRLGEVASVTKGSQLKIHDVDEDGQVPHLNGGMQPSNYTNKSNVKANTIAISEGGNSCGYVQFMTQAYWCGGHCYSVVPKGIDNRFLYHALKGSQAEIMALRVGSGLPNVQKSALLSFEIRFPKSNLEQIAIAEALSEMDSEIDILEIRRRKMSDLKQGMMQALLTGKIRLV